MCPLFFVGVHGGYMGNLFNRCRRCFLYLVLLIPIFALAETETKPAAQSTVAKVGKWRTDNSALFPSSVYFESPATLAGGITACKAIRPPASTEFVLFTINTWNDAGNCAWRDSANPNFLVQFSLIVVQDCPVGAVVTDGQCVKYSCDAGWTGPDSAHMCSRVNCPLGSDPGPDGQCLKDCTGKRGMSTVNNGYEFTGAVSNWSVGGCRVRCDQRVLASGGGMGYSCKFTGASADPDNPEAEALPPDPKELPPEEPKDCFGKGQGYIKSSSGKITCIPASDAPAGNKPDAFESDSAKEKGKPGDAGYVKEETTNSSDKDGNTTTTKKETKNGTPDGNGGVTCPDGYVKNSDNTCTKTTTEKQTTKGFCEENPNATVCKEAEKSVFGGGCESGFTCTGDAAQCAAARATWETRCMYREDATTPLHDAANPGGTPAQIDAAEKALNRDGSRSFDVGSEFAAKNNAYVGFSSTCPIADQTFTIARATVSVPASIICSIGAFIKLLIHIVAYMAVLRLFAFKLV